MTDKYWITYDSDKEDALLMKTGNGIIIFKSTPEGLYTFKPTASYLKHVDETECMYPPTETIGAQLSNMVLIVTENSKGFTQRQFEKWKKIKKTLSYCWMRSGW